MSFVLYSGGNPNKGVHSFRIAADGSWIELKFQPSKNWIYRYDSERPGAAAVAEMIRLALAHAGLSSYVSQHVKDDYVSKRQA